MPLELHFSGMFLTLLKVDILKMNCHVTKTSDLLLYYC